MFWALLAYAVIGGVMGLIVLGQAINDAPDELMNCCVYAAGAVVLWPVILVWGLWRVQQSTKSHSTAMHDGQEAN